MCVQNVNAASHAEMPLPGTIKAKAVVQAADQVWVVMAVMVRGVTKAWMGSCTLAKLLMSRIIWMTMKTVAKNEDKHCQVYAGTKLLQIRTIDSRRTANKHSSPGNPVPILLLP